MDLLTRLLLGVGQRRQHRDRRSHDATPDLPRNAVRPLYDRDCPVVGLKPGQERGVNRAHRFDAHKAAVPLLVRMEDEKWERHHFK